MDPLRTWNSFLEASEDEESLAACKADGTFEDFACESCCEERSMEYDRRARLRMMPDILNELREKLGKPAIARDAFTIGGMTYDEMAETKKFTKFG